MSVSSSGLDGIHRAVIEGWRGNPIYVVAPPDMGLAVERALLARLGAGAGFRLRVTHWGRLAAEIVREEGGRDRPLLGMGGWVALVRSLLRLRPDIVSGLDVPPEGRRGVERRIAVTLWDALFATLGKPPGPFDRAFPASVARALGKTMGLLEGHLDRIWTPPTLMREAARILDDRREGGAGWAFVLDSDEPAIGPRLLGPSLKKAFRYGSMTTMELALGSRAAQSLPDAPIRFATAPDMRSEARFLALEARRKISLGARPEDILIGAASLDTLAPHLEDAFDMAGIPIDLALARTASGGPARLVRGLCRLGEGVDDEAVLEVASSGLVPELSEPNRLAALRSGRRARRAFVSSGESLLMRRLVAFGASWPEGVPLWDHLGHVAPLVHDLGATRVLRERGGRPLEEWNAVTEALRTVADATGPIPLSSRDARSILIGAAEGCRLPVSTPRLGAVLATGLKSVASHSSRHILLAGLVDGTVPPRVVPDGFVPLPKTDHPIAGWHRERELWERALGERLMATRAETFTLTRPLTSDDGRPLEPALFLSQVGERAVRVENVTYLPDDVGEPLSRQDAGRLLAQDIGTRARLGEDWTGEAALAHALMVVGGGQFALRSLDDDHPESEPPLPRGLASKLFGRTSSPTQLEARARCPTQHWARQVGIAAPESEILDPVHWGRTVHGALKGLLADGGLSGLSATGLIWRVARAVRRAMEEDGLTPPDRQIRHLMMIELLRVARRLADDEASSAFQVEDTERKIGFHLRLDDGQELELRGRIDRIDRAGDLVRIIDYKTGKIDVSYQGLLSGLELQLATYALALRGGQGNSGGPRGGRPVALYLWPVPFRGELVDAPDGKGLARGESALRPRGLMAEDPEALKALGPHRYGYALPRAVLESYLNEASSMIRALAQEALDGVVAPHPAKKGSELACRSCDLKPVCRFEGGTFREIAKVDRKEFLAHFGEGADQA